MNFKNVPETLAAVVGLMIGGATASYALAPKIAPKVPTMVQPVAVPVVTAPVHHVVKHHHKHVVMRHTMPVAAPAVHTLPVPTENPANTLNFLQGGGGNN